MLVPSGPVQFIIDRFVFETGTHTLSLSLSLLLSLSRSLGQAGLELVIFLPPAPK